MKEHFYNRKYFGIGWEIYCLIVLLATIVVLFTEMPYLALLSFVLLMTPFIIWLSDVVSPKQEVIIDNENVTFLKCCIESIGSRRIKFKDSVVIKRSDIKSTELRNELNTGWHIVINGGQENENVFGGGRFRNADIVKINTILNGESYEDKEAADVAKKMYGDTTKKAIIGIVIGIVLGILYVLIKEYIKYNL